MKKVTGSINFNVELKGIEWSIKSHLSKEEVRFLQSDKVGLGYNRKTGKFYIGLKQVDSLEKLSKVYAWMVSHTEDAVLDEKTFKKVFSKEKTFGKVLKPAAPKKTEPKKTEPKLNYSKMTKAELIALLESK